MAKNFEHLIHKNSNVIIEGAPKLPTSGQIEYGELAVNYAKDKETISLKNSDNEIVTFSSDAQIQSFFKETEEIIANSLNDINARLVSVNKLVEENELVTAAALNDINSRLGEGGGDVSEEIEELITNFEELSLGTATALNDLNSRITTLTSDVDEIELGAASALNDLDKRITETNSSITELESAIDEMDEVTASSLNDLNGRIINIEDDVETIWDIEDSLSNITNVINNNTINGSSLNDGTSYWYGTSTTAAATVQKEVSIPSIKTLNPGQVIIVKPTITSTVANSTLKLNNFDAYPMRYNNAAITESTNSIVWSASYPSWWLFDGSYWVFAGHGVDTDTNTTYSTISQAEIETGTGTDSRLVSAKVLRDNFYTETEVDNLVTTISQAEIEAGTGTDKRTVTAKLLRDNFYTETEVDTAINNAPYAGSVTNGGPALKSNGLIIATVDTTSTATAFTVQIPEFADETGYRDGMFFLLYNNKFTSATGYTVDVNGFGAKPVFTVSNKATRSTTGFAKDAVFPFWYDSSVDDGNGGWVYGTLIDKNTDTVGYSLRSNSKKLPMSDAVSRYRLLFTSADGTKYVPSTTSTSTNATAARTVCQTPINPFGEIVYYGTTTTVAAGSSPAATTLWQQYAIGLGYSFNTTGAALTLTLWKPVYIKCAPQSDGSAIIDATTPYVQDLPSTDDGKIYIFLGIAYSATAVEMMYYHPVYYYKDGAIRLWTNAPSTVTGVKMNGTTNNPTNGVVDLGTVITSHQDISGKADKSAAIGSLSLSLNNTNYQITLSGTKVDGTAFTVSDIIDLPLESVVVNGSYNNTTKKVVLTLQNGSTVEFSVADLVAGLQSEITSTNKLSADLISDGTTNKTVTATEKSTWNGKQDALSNANVLSGITSTKVSNWDSAATNSHTHSNKSVLDGIKATDITNWNSKTDNVGTVTGVKMNGTTNNPTNGVVDLGTVITSETELRVATDGRGNVVQDIKVNGHDITLVKYDNYLTSHQSIKTLNGTALTGTGNITLTGVPAFTSADNGKILGVVNGQLAWVTPSTIYTGTGTPSSTQGNDGDIYLQTS